MKQSILKAVIINIFLSAVIFAKADNYVHALSATSFGIYPPKIAIVTPPDQNIEIPLKLINTAGLENIAFSSSQITSDEEGNIQLTNKPDEASSWMKIENKELGSAAIRLDTGTETSLALKIAVPKNVIENDHYFALIASIKNEETSSTTHSRAIAQIAVPIILSIKESSVPETLIVEKFSLPKISFSSQVPIALKLKNPGNYLVQTAGTISSESPFKKHQEILPIVPILSQTSRLIGGKKYFLQTGSIGPTKVTISIQLDQSPALVISQTVFIIPLYLVAIIASLILALVIVLNSRRLQKA